MNTENNTDITSNLLEDLNMIPYNTSMAEIRLPEFGRNFQRLVDHCVNIADREERKSFAEQLIKILARRFPQKVGERNDMSKLWDQLNIMSDFRLDIDFPVEVITKEEFNPKPERIPYTQGKVKHRIYGSNIETLIRKAMEMENSDEKDILVFTIANEMKRIMTMSNKSAATDARIFHDLDEMSFGHISLDAEQFHLNDFTPEKKNSGKTKKAKKSKRK